MKSYRVYVCMCICIFIYTSRYLCITCTVQVEQMLADRIITRSEVRFKLHLVGADLEHGGPEASNCIWFERAQTEMVEEWWHWRLKVQWARACSSVLASSIMALELQNAIGSSGLARMGFEHCSPKASKCNWLERARADLIRSLWHWSFEFRLARAGSSGWA